MIYGTIFSLQNELITTKPYMMKATKGIEAVLNAKGTLYQSYHQGWTKALENFEKSRLDFGIKTKNFYRLHDN